MRALDGARMGAGGCIVLLEALLRFWKAGLAASELLPGQGGQYKLPTSASTLNTVLSAVCFLAESSLGPLSSPGTCTQLSAKAWEEVFYIFALVLGPLGCNNSDVPAPTLDDGMRLLYMYTLRYATLTL